MYTYQNPDPVFGIGATDKWWEALSDDLKVSIVDTYIRGKAAAEGVPILPSVLARFQAALTSGDPDPTNLVGIAREILLAYDRPVAEGGGFVVGSACYCPPTSPGAVSTQIRSDQRCPAGTGGAPLAAPLVAGTHAVEQMLVGMPKPKPPGSDITTATIKGKVVDASDVGIAGALVSVAPPAGGMPKVGSMVSVLTGADGSFLANVVPTRAGKVIVTIGATGYGAFTSPELPAVKGSTTDVPTIMLPVAAGGPPVNCAGGLVLGPDGVTCVPVGDGSGDGSGDGVHCPEGLVLSPDGVTCVALGEKTDAAAKPWYKSKWTYIIGGVVIVGGGIAVAVSRRGR